MRLTLLQRFRSYFYPLIVRRESSDLNPVLDLLYYRGHWQLATADALYSDGIHYRPLVTAFKAIKPFLPQIKNVLVLGTGLASAVQILNAQGFHPAFTLVELDSKVLELAMEFMPARAAPDIRPVCVDAEQFVRNHQVKYDLLIVDVFNGRDVPEFVLGPEFIRNCAACLAPKGILLLNYMVNSVKDEGKAKAALGAAFKNIRELSLGINRVYIATV